MYDRNTMEEDFEVDQVLFICRNVKVYRTPPLVSASAGFRSGEWRHGDQIFEGTLKVVQTGNKCNIRIEDSNRY